MMSEDILALYHAACAHFCHCREAERELKGKVEALLLACYLNLALCHLKSGRHKKAVEAASRVMCRPATHTMTPLLLVCIYDVL